ncbi:FtsX-like permease family protein [Nonomuraea sp. NPDC049152]|uniref:FtsX-like permease family protein n=1 Tax=Nonomuraea sp. NPDC049152 TaxID=3154350 RepID=UPI0033D4FA47
MSHTSRDIHARARHTATVAAQLVLLVGIATGTLYMQSTEDAAQREPAVADEVSVQLAPVNYLVVIMIIGFSSIVVINTLVAATRRRQREFGLLRLSAATGGQVLRMVTIEAVITTIVAVTLGTVAAAATAVPYSLVKIGSPIASGSPWMYVAIVVGAFLLAASATTPTALSTLRTRPVDALTAT